MWSHCSTFTEEHRRQNALQRSLRHQRCHERLRRHRCWFWTRPAHETRYPPMSKTGHTITMTGFIPWYRFYSGFRVSRKKTLRQETFFIQTFCHRRRGTGVMIAVRVPVMCILARCRSLLGHLNVAQPSFTLYVPPLLSYFDKLNPIIPIIIPGFFFSASLSFRRQWFNLLNLLFKSSFFQTWTKTFHQLIW